GRRVIEDLAADVEGRRGIRPGNRRAFERAVGEGADEHRAVAGRQWASALDADVRRVEELWVPRAAGLGEWRPGRVRSVVDRGRATARCLHLVVSRPGDRRPRDDWLVDV